MTEDSIWGAGAPDVHRPSLADRFVVPPTTTLFTTSGEWQARRRLWLSLGIESELGRGLSNASAAMSLEGLPDRSAAARWGPDSARHADDPVAATRGTAPRRSSGLTDHRSNSAVGKMTRRPSMAPRVAHRPGESSGRLTGSAGRANAERYTRAKADQHSNLSGAAPLPDYADFGMENVAPGTSIFDPVLTECAYRWWCPEGGTILDPFAGGSVRGVVAEYLGYHYTGIELRAEQVAANRLQAERLGVAPHWIAGDSGAQLPLLPPGAQFDFVFSCPPYYNLEVYSDDPADISNLPTYEAFLVEYEAIIAASVARLRDDRFACFVVSDVRDTKGKLGHYHGLHGDTIAILKRHGLRLYNDAVLINSYGTLPMRMGKQMEASRKLGRSHQNVVVVAKGTPNPRDWDMRVDIRPPSPQLTLWGGTVLDQEAAPI